MNREPFKRITQAIFGDVSFCEGLSLQQIQDMEEKHPHFHTLAFYKARGQEDFFFPYMINPIWGKFYRDFLYTDQEEKEKTQTPSVETKELKKDSLDETAQAEEVSTNAQDTSKTSQQKNENLKPAVKKIATTSPKKSTKKKAQKRIFRTKKLENQLHSFTGWLRELDHIPKSKLKVQSFDIKRIEKDASQSIKSSEIITESMAQVWLQQDEPKKAIAVYKKLSLLFPDKSAYFATKIDAIKKSHDL